MDIITQVPWLGETLKVPETPTQTLEELLSPAKKALLIAATDTDRFTVIR